MKLKLFPNFYESTNNKINSNFVSRNNHIIAKIKAGYDNFNEVTIKLLGFAIKNVLSNVSKDKKSILIANDGSHKFLAFFENELIDKINGDHIDSYGYEKNEPVSRAFCSFTNSVSEAFVVIIYLHKYDNNNFAISLYGKNNEPLNHKIIEYILDEYTKVSIDLVKDSNTQMRNLNFRKILKEYTDFLLSKNFTKNANHILKIGVISSALQDSFVKKILGKNDIAYTVLKDTFKLDKPNYLKFSIFKLALLKNVDYIFKFSFDYEKVYLYRRNNKQKYFIQYDLVDISDLVINYLSFTNNYTNTNNDFKNLKSIATSNLCKKENITNIANKYKINLGFSWKFDSKNIEKPDFMFFNEDYQVYFSNDKKIKYDAFLFFNILVDMLNYYQTQEMRYDDICDQNLDLSNKLIISEFVYDCHPSNVVDFETKLYMQDSIAQLKVSTIEDVRKNFKDSDTKYVAKFNFEQREWMAIKYDAKYEKLIFVIQEKNNTRGNIAKKIKKFMYKFTIKYDKPLINLIE
ncbi:hypothetical protein ACWXVM_03040 [Mycoplasma sp. 2261]